MLLFKHNFTSVTGKESACEPPQVLSWWTLKQTGLLNLKEHFKTDFHPIAKVISLLQMSIPSKLCK
jgi:hypothetical protein